MSAYIVSKKHIDCLVKIIESKIGSAHWHAYSTAYANRWMGVPLDNTGAVDRDALGQRLWDENHESINYRYQLEDKAPNYRYEVPREVSCHGLCMSIAQQVRLFDCYDYQTCEHPGWGVSPMKMLCEKMTNALLRSTITEAEWGATRWGID